TALGTAPADPLFLYYFPDALRNATAGQWKLSWKFGFHLTCSTSNVSELYYYHFDHMEPTELIFSVAEGGQSLDLNTLNSSCPDSAFSTTYEVVDYQTVRDDCPILSETDPEPSPFATLSKAFIMEESQLQKATVWALDNPTESITTTAQIFKVPPSKLRIKDLGDSK
ncbi:hypothetical protein V491_04594, partial [Pseudogymnoascus sp. VKM F-3775]